ncbi:HEPN domain-containing protein [Xanthobacter aminoxidans]|uniref:HEPN domain-containing protein n=1 Tax=Xanthobacter aminoxidans TaxID=186280 RepID=A0ABW6ZMX9_9HYPH
MVGASADEWWRRAESELESAKILKISGKAAEAYFHAGQAIEFGLKALYLKRNNLSEMPADHKGANWHNLAMCATAARLHVDLKQPGVSRDLRAAWLTVRDWKSNARFPDMKVPKQEINDLFVAVCNDRDGVWQWLRRIYQSI